MKAQTMLWALILSIALVGAVSAADVTVVQGDPLSITADTGIRGNVAEARATFAITDISYYRQLTLRNQDNPVFTDEVDMDVDPGTYSLTILVEVNRETVSYERVSVEVVSRRSAQAAMITDEPEVRIYAPSTVRERISIPPVPDLVPGEQFVLPVLVRGDGVYTLEIPTLPFGTYEIPNPVVVNGEKLVPVLIRVDKNAQAGTYTIPIYMAGEQIDARVRIIRYTTRPIWVWSLIGLGLLLIVIALVLAFVLGNRDGGEREERRAPPRTRTTDSDDELITYY
jgi:hypothetical protein